MCLSNLQLERTAHAHLKSKQERLADCNQPVVRVRFQRCVTLQNQVNVHVLAITAR